MLIVALVLAVIGLTALVEVVADLHVLPEILHGTGNPTTGFIETNHCRNS